MNYTVRGRVYSVCTNELVLLSNGEKLVYSADADLFSHLSVGDLVELSVHKNVVESFSVLFRPKVELRDAFRWQQGQKTRFHYLRSRQKIATSIRHHLEQEDFLEIASPLLVKGACPDAHLDSFLLDADKALVSSCEYQLKRLLVGGIERLYSMTQNFRVDPVTERHNPEFTMLEWARAWASIEDIESDAERIVLGALKSIKGSNAKTCVWNGCTVNLDCAPWPRLSVQEALRLYLNINVSEYFRLDELLQQADLVGLKIPESFREDRSYVLSYILDIVTPYLGKDKPIFLIDWPSFLTSSAQLVEMKSHLAIRSELFIAGLEIADGFPFAQHAGLQQEHFWHQQQLRQHLGKKAVPIDAAYIHALKEGIPFGAGMALGIDRLVMVLSGAADISKVLAFDWNEL